MDNVATTQLDNISAPKPVTFILAIVAVVIVVASAFYLSLQKTAISNQSDRIDEEITGVKNEISLLEGQKVEATRVSQQYLDSIEAEEILWSRAISRINSILPIDSLTNKNIVNILSYSGAQGGKLTFNVVSRPVTDDPYADVAQMLKSFNESSYFANAYVPSITQGENDQSEKTASFVFNVDYNEKMPEDSQVKVSRQ